MKTVLCGLLMVSLMGCSALTKQETTQSNLPTAATLTAQCAAGAAQTPPIRAGACDDYNIEATACQSLTAQPLIPAQALAICTANGFALTGGFKPL
jgi:hypothetical protein